MGKAITTYAVAHHHDGSPYLMKFPSKKAFYEFKHNAPHWGVRIITEKTFEANKDKCFTITYE